MIELSTDSQFIKQILNSTKTIAMVGISSIKNKEQNSTSIIRRPSIIVMKYLQEFGYQVIPVNPYSAGKKIHGEMMVEKLEDISIPIDIVNVFRPSSETPKIAKKAVEIGAKTLWLQYGIQSREAQNIVERAKVNYISNKCIKQEYQRLFLKVNPVFPVLQ